MVFYPQLRDIFKTYLKECEQFVNDAWAPIYFNMFSPYIVCVFSHFTPDNELFTMKYAFNLETLL